MTVSTLNAEQLSCFHFKASFSPCMIFQLIRIDFDILEKQLKQTISKAPNLFLGSPVVIDLEKIKTHGAFNVIKLKHILMAAGLVPIGVRGGTIEQQEAAIIDGLPILNNEKITLTEKVPPAVNTESTPTFAKFIATPIRSGMQIYAKGCDLIVAAAVSAGAELLADGNIHIYGPLRGRALAGVQGNTQARIFCRSLEQAELISIAGYYLTKEDIQANEIKEGTIQIYLDNTHVRILSL